MNIAKRLPVDLPLTLLLVLRAALDLQLRNRGVTFEDVWLPLVERQTRAGVNPWSCLS